jgi:transposase
MMGRLKSEQVQLFYQFNLEDAAPDDHLVRRIDAALDLSWLRSELAPHYSSTGRPSIDPELMIRMLVMGYVFAIRSERLVYREVQVNLAYRWFCKLGIEDAIPDHSAFSRARNERFREGDVFRRVFERVVEGCIVAGLVGGEGFAVDASLIQGRCQQAALDRGSGLAHAAGDTVSQGMYFWHRSRKAVGGSRGSTLRQAASNLRLATTLVMTGILKPLIFSSRTTGFLPARSDSNAVAVMSKR